VLPMTKLPCYRASMSRQRHLDDPIQRYFSATISRHTCTLVARPRQCCRTHICMTAAAAQHMPDSCCTMVATCHSRLAPFTLPVVCPRLSPTTHQQLLLRLHRNVLRYDQCPANLHTTAHAALDGSGATTCPIEPLVSHTVPHTTTNNSTVR
jgi:hypothetical protein